MAWRSQRRMIGRVRHDGKERVVERKRKGQEEGERGRREIRAYRSAMC